jgi:hypothetical protein
MASVQLLVRWRCVHSLTLLVRWQAQPGENASARRDSSLRRPRPDGTARCDQARARQEDGAS